MTYTKIWTQKTATAAIGGLLVERERERERDMNTHTPLRTKQENFYG